MCMADFSSFFKKTWCWRLRAVHIMTILFRKSTIRRKINWINSRCSLSEPSSAFLWRLSLPACLREGSISRTLQGWRLFWWVWRISRNICGSANQDKDGIVKRSPAVLRKILRHSSVLNIRFNPQDFCALHLNFLRCRQILQPEKEQFQVIIYWIDRNKDC